jgi:hypothetical protein
MESLIKQANDFVASLLSGDSPSTEMTYSSSASTLVSNDSFESSSLMVASTPASTAVDLQSEESKSEETLVSQSHRVEELESKLRSLQGFVSMTALSRFVGDFNSSFMQLLILSEILQEQAQEHEENVHTLQTEMKGVQSQLMIKALDCTSFYDSILLLFLNFLFVCFVLFFCDQIAELETNENSMNELRGHWTSERMEFQHKLLQAQQENQVRIYLNQQLHFMKIETNFPTFHIISLADAFQMNVERVSLAYRELEAAHKKASSLQNLLQINEAQSRYSSRRCHPESVV